MKPLPIRNSSALQVGKNVGTIGYPFEQLKKGGEKEKFKLK